MKTKLLEICHVGMGVFRKRLHTSNNCVCSLFRKIKFKNINAPSYCV
jgi:hypothetical protein